MLKTTLLHPEILGTLGHLGHGSKILIGDGNYPVYHRVWPAAKVVFLDLSSGQVNAADVLAALVTAKVIWSAAGRAASILANVASISRISWTFKSSVSHTALPLVH
jgi:L-fucose mutarotase/ribose pyranase (RbsD/FucU family)